MKSTNTKSMRVSLDDDGASEPMKSGISYDARGA